MVHSDIKSHTRGVLTMVKGEIQTISMKQKINKKSYIEASFVAANYVLSHFLWTNNSLNHKGCYFGTTLHQYNTSEILLETNRM